MAEFRAIYTRFWRDPEINALTPEDRYFFIYLLTNPETTSCGIYQTTINHMIADTGYNAETIHKLLNHLQDLGKIQWNPEQCEVFIKNWIRWNAPKNPSMRDKVVKDLAYVKTPEFRDEFIRIATELGHQLDTVSTSSTHRPARGNGNGNGNRNNTDQGGASSPDLNGNGQKAKPQSPYPRLADLPKLNARDRGYPDEFEEFWSVYPRNRAKGSAYKAWRSLVRKGEDPTHLHNAAKAWAEKCRVEGTDVEYIRHAASFLNSGDFEEWITEDGKPINVQANSRNGHASVDLDNLKQTYLDCARQWKQLRESDPDRAEKLKRDGTEVAVQLENHGVDVQALKQEAGLG